MTGSKQKRIEFHSQGPYVPEKEDMMVNTLVVGTRLETSQSQDGTLRQKMVGIL